MEYIDIEKNSIPYTFEIVLAGETFQFTVNYNSFGDFFTVDLYKNNELVRMGEKIVYGLPLFENYEYLGAESSYYALRYNRKCFKNLIRKFKRGCVFVCWVRAIGLEI